MIRFPEHRFSTTGIIATGLFFAVATFWTAVTGLWPIAILAGITGVVVVFLLVGGRPKAQSTRREE